jgi:hypothetical protein
MEEVKTKAERQRQASTVLTLVLKEH